MRGVVDAVATGTGVLALLLMGIGTLVFILFIELTIAKAEASLSLLLQMGYSPRYLGMFMLRRFVPLIVITLMASAIIALILQEMIAAKGKALNVTLPDMPGWPMWVALAASAGVLLAFVSRSIFRAINQE
jgi:hypothetical protein